MGWRFWRKPAAPAPPEAACEPELQPAPPAAVAVEYRRGPAAAAWLARALAPVERLFDILWGSQANPLYRSGTLAVLFLLLATVSGVFLIFFYRLGEPYASIQRLQADPWFGRWMRSWHRYLSDAAALATAYHLLRMAADGKAWGARALAWISGIVLAGVMALTAWTGLVMVWDRHGQMLAIAGARVADLLPVFSEPISRAFSGGMHPPPSFFFMNLFLHVALPLGLVFLLWLHTSRLARSAWLPERRHLWGWAVALLILAVLWPAPLGAPADALDLGGAYWLSPWYTPWLPLSLRLPPLASLLGGLAAVALLVSVPWWWKPAVGLLPLPSHNDEARCQGCVTCASDCPFEAIAMVPREVGSGSALVARVDPALCVSCGLCVASCDRLSIGPADRIGTRQLAAVQELGRTQPGDAVVLVHCLSNPVGPRLLERIQASGQRVVPYGMDCLGDLHPFAVNALQKHFKGLYLLSCTPSACKTREGATLVQQRLYEGRQPSPHVAIDLERLCLVQADQAQAALAFERWQGFNHALGLAPAPEPVLAAVTDWCWVVQGLSALALAGVLGMLSALNAGAPEPGAALRVSLRLPGQSVKTCRDLSAAEIEALPAHMRRKQECKAVHLSYELSLKLDGQTVKSMQVSPGGVHGDAPLDLDFQLALTPGRHRVQAEFLPLGDDQGQARRFKVDAEADAKPNRALLLTLDKDGKAFELLENAR